MSRINFQCFVHRAIAQTELRRFHYDRILLARVEYTFRYHDPCRTGRVDRETLRATVKGAKIPLFKDLLNFLVDKLVCILRIYLIHAANFHLSGETVGMAGTEKRMINSIKLI